MMLTYRARIWHDADDDTWQVEFPDVTGAVTAGDTFEEAIGNAREALTGVLGSILDRGLPVPRPAAEPAEDRFPIQAEPEVVVPIMMRWTREDEGLTQAQVAERLGITQQAYQKLERTGGNPSVKTLAKVARALGREFMVRFEPSLTLHSS